MLSLFLANDPVACVTRCRLLSLCVLLTGMLALGAEAQPKEAQSVQESGIKIVDTSRLATSVTGREVTSPDSGRMPPVLSDNQYEFAFARLVYNGDGNDGWGPRWRVDWPEAETHLLAGIDRLTRVDTNPQGALVQLDDDAIFDYPWLYAVEVGALSLNDFEAARLREYLLRGGFLMVDDFHGPFQWDNFAYAMQQVFPDRPVRHLAVEDEIFHVLYELNERTQIPGLRPLREGRTWERGGNVPHWRGIVDDDGRVMVAINFNMDLGDAWEHADWAEYPEPYSAMAYRFAVNYVIYSMTH